MKTQFIRISLCTILIFGALITPNPTTKVVQAAIPDGLRIWNKLGSDTEVMNSEIGPSFGTRPGVIYVGGVYGNALATTDGENGDGDYLTMAPDDFFGADYTNGTVEAWVQKRMQQFFPFETPLVNIFGRQMYNGGYSSITAFWSDGLTGSGGLELFIVDSAGVYHSTNDLAWNNVPVGQWVHVAFVWDLGGIAGSTDTLRIYRDGNLVGSSSQTISDIKPDLNEVRILGHTVYSRYGQPTAYLDNMLVWEQAKTDFSHRFNESPLSPPEIVPGDITVCSVNADYTSIQTAIDVARPGVTIGICAGMYFENLTINKNLKLQGAGAGKTILNGQSLQTTVVIEEAASVSVTGVTVTNGVRTMSGEPPSEINGGGGVWNRGVLNLSDCTIFNNEAYYNIPNPVGGGIFNSGTLTINSCVIDANRSPSGAGIFNAATGHVTMNNSTVSQNGGPSTGGGISNHGTLIASSVIITNNNTYERGGGILNGSGSATFTDSIIANNSAVKGSGIYNQAGGSVTLIRTTVSSNSSSEAGAGLYNTEDSTLKVDSSTIIGNQLPEGGSGIGIFNLGTLLVERSTIAENGPSASFDPNLAAKGGGIHNEGSANVAWSIIRKNSAYHGNGGRAGGGIWNSGTITVETTSILDNQGGSGAGIFNTGSGQFRLINSTLHGNNGPGGGGGITNSGVFAILNCTITENDTGGGPNGVETFGSSATLTIQNSIVANNGSLANCGGTITSLGHNLDSDGTCSLTASGDKPNMDPLLGPLADNGGSTLTHALLMSSPALDGGDNAACPATDQRGLSRPQGAACDIGAFELEQVNPGTLIGTCAGHPVYEKNGVYTSPGWNGTIKVGDKRNNTLNGTTSADLILGLGGNDLINGKGGKDVICGGDGVDFLLGEGGDDVLDGGLGNDVLNGGSGDYDQLYAYDGNDTLLDGDGVSVASAGAGNDDMVIVLRNGWRNYDGQPIFDGLTAGYGNDKAALAILESTPFVFNISGDEVDDPANSKEGKNDKLALIANVAPASNIVKFENIYTPRSDEVAAPAEDAGAEYLSESVGEEDNRAVYLPLLTR